MDEHSFTARRAAASSLPHFSLPPPDILAFGPHSNILTPPAHAHSDLSPSPSAFQGDASGPGMGHGAAPATATSFAATPGVAQLPAYWPQQSLAYGHSFSQPAYMGRPLSSPSLNFPHQRLSNASMADGPPDQPYDLPAFFDPAAPATAAQKQPLVIDAGVASTAHHYGGGRPPPTPTMSLHGSNSSPSFSPYGQQQNGSVPSPDLQQPAVSRISPGGLHSLMTPSYQPSYTSYPLPDRYGGRVPHTMQLGMYAQQPAYPQPPAAAMDRPFKCDECSQSFNRNHDLKRHKRIHLAVKPFPCTHCDKSFSRKDALKVGTVGALHC
jgi:hypothetical protein